MQRKIFFLVCFLLLVDLLSVEAQIPPMMNYQGFLADPSTGIPVPDSAYSITFSIYSTSAGGTALWSETQKVITRNGLFSVLLGSRVPLPADLFDNKTLYLGVKIGSDPEISPRRQLVSVGYAFKAANAEMVSGKQLDVNDGQVNQSSDPISWYRIKDIPPGLADGVDDVGTSTGGVSQINVGTGMNVTNPAGPTVQIGLNMGHGNKINADMVDGKHGSDFAPVSHSHDAANITSGTLDNARLNMGHGKGLNADMVDGKHSSDFATRAHSHDASDITSGTLDNARLNTGHGNGLNADMVDGKHASELGADNLGNHTATTNLKLNGNWLSGDGDNEGVFVTSGGNVGIGTSSPSQKLTVNGNVYSLGLMVKQQGITSGGPIVTGNPPSSIPYDQFDIVSGNDIWATGKIVANGDGITGRRNSSNPAVAGFNSSTGPGLYGKSASGHGVYGEVSNSSAAVFGLNNGSGYGLYGVSRGGYGVFASSSITAGYFVSDNGIGIYAKGAKYALHARGDVIIENGGVWVNSKRVHDFAEPFELVDKENLEQGDVVVIDPANPEHLKKSEKAYDPLVAGVVSSLQQAGLIIGARKDNSKDKPIALVGRVLCKVDARYAPIQVGDLLTTSDTPGHAMKAIDPKPGTIIGKALQPLESGTGKILILISLQ